MAIPFPRQALAYGEPFYWDERYNAERAKHGKDHCFEWYCDLDDLWPILEMYGGSELATSSDRSLIIGAGDSKLGEQMLERGFHFIQAIDFCKTVVDFMDKRYEHQPRLQYSIVDARKLDRYPTDHFQFIVDKGCTDATFCSWNSYLEVLRLNQEVCRVLEPGRFFLLVTYGSAPTRMPHLTHDSLPWKVETMPLPGKPGVFCYICTKLHPHELSRAQRASQEDRRKRASFEKHEEVDIEWERRKLAPSCTTFKDKYTRGQVRTVRVRDADMLLEQIEQARKDAEELSIQSQEQSGDGTDKRASRASRELARASRGSRDSL